MTVNVEGSVPDGYMYMSDLMAADPSTLFNGYTGKIPGDGVLLGVVHIQPQHDGQQQGQCHV